jgi:hypothetical protein
MASECLLLLFGEQNMNKLSLSLAFAAAITLVPSICAHHACADQLYKTGELQKATWHKSVPSYYVEDRTPKVKYQTKADPEPIYIIDTRLPQPQPAPVVVLPGAPQSGSAGGGVAVPPGFAVLDPNQLGQAKFGTNIPAAGLSPAQSLPDGVSTNRLAGKAWPGAPKSGAGIVAAPARALPAGNAVPATMTYAPTRSGTGSSSSAVSVKTSVDGQVVKRGQLLK